MANHCATKLFQFLPFHFPLSISCHFPLLWQTTVPPNSSSFTFFSLSLSSHSPSLWPTTVPPNSSSFSHFMFTLSLSCHHCDKPNNVHFFYFHFLVCTLFPFTFPVTLYQIMVSSHVTHISTFLHTLSFLPIQGSQS